MFLKKRFNVLSLLMLNEFLSLFHKIKFCGILGSRRSERQDVLIL